MMNDTRNVRPTLSSNDSGLNSVEKYTTKFAAYAGVNDDGFSLPGVGAVADVLEGLGGILSRLLQQHLLAARML